MQNIDPDSAALASLDDVDFVRRLARGLLRDGHAADDVAQETWAAALRRDGMRAAIPTRAWLAGVVRNLARGRVRAEARRREVERFAARAEADQVGPAERIALQQRLLAAVAALEETQRDAIVLRYFEGCSTAEVARREGVGHAAARKRISRGLAGLRGRLERELGPDDHFGGGWSRAIAALAAAPRRWAGLGLALSAKWIAAGAGLLGVGVLIALRAGVGHGGASVPTGAGGAASPFAVDLDSVERADEAGGPNGAPNGSPATRSLGIAAPLDTEPKGVAGKLELAVVDAQLGQPLADARAWASIEGEAVELVSDGSGVFTLADATVEADGRRFAAAAPGRVAAWVASSPQDPTPSRLVLALEPAAALGGRVTFEGGTVPEVPAFTLETVDVDRADDWPTELAAELAPWLPWRDDYPVQLKPDGRFQIEGLPALWRGGLWAGDRYLFESVRPEHLAVFAHYLPLDTAEPELEIHLAEPPLLSGRLVWAASGAPVESGSIGLSLLFADGTKSYRDAVAIQPDGRFAKALTSYTDPFAERRLQSVHAEAWPAGGERTEFVFEELDAGGPFQLEDLAVRRVDDLFVRVEDERGDPIPGAMVAGILPRDYGSARAHRLADDDGRVQLPGLPAERNAVLVTAFGRRATEFDFGGDRGSADAPRTVRLPQAASVIVRAVGRPEVVESVQLRLRPDGPLFASPRFASAAVSTPEQVDWLREIEQDGWTDDDGWHYLGGGGTWRLSDLEPGVELELRLIDRDRRTLSQGRATAPTAGELIVELEVEAATAHFVGRVLSPAGAGIGGVSIRLDTGTGQPAQVMATDVDGSFTGVVLIDPASVVAVELHRATWVTRRIPLQPGSPVYDLGELELDPARSVVVDVRDTLGAELRPSSLCATLDDGRRIDGGLLARRPRIGGLPNLAATVHVRVGGRDYSVPVTAADRIARLTLPVHGTLRYTVDGALADYDAETPRSIEVRSRADDSVTLHRRDSEPWSLDLLPGEYVVADPAGERTVQVTAGETADVTRP